MSRGVDTRCAATGVRLRGPLAVARGVGFGVVVTGGGAGGAALGGLNAVAICASARMRGVITGVGAVEENDGAGGGA